MSGSNCCAACKSNYKYLTDRWARDKKLKKWFQSKTPEQKQTWFQQRKKNKSNRRSFEDLGYEEADIQEVHEGEDELDHYKPWSLYKRHRLQEGHTLEEAKQYWAEDLADDTIDKKFVRGQWCIAEFEGVMAARGNKRAIQISSKRGTQLQSQADLDRLEASGKATLNQAAKSFATTVARSRRSLDEPELDEGDVELPASLPTPVSVLASVMQKEVKLSSCHHRPFNCSHD